MATTVGRMTSAEITPTGGSLVTVGGPLSGAIIRDDELVEKQYSDSRQKSYFGGGVAQGVRVTCTDKEAFTALKKGTRITTAVLTFEECYDADGTILGATEITATLTGGIVTEAVELESSTDGAPAEFAITMMLCRGKTGTEGTFTVA